MSEKELFALSDKELLNEAKKMKKTSVLSALLIGFMIGVIIFSAVKSTWGFFTLIPLYFIYKMIKSPSNKNELERILTERNLKT